ncbi:hypothetical protein LUW77_03460 [Streptomyces radiopugnans]|nr:hypothetical protein LUW77_03460 [Streptomyces radiopugnans]
MVAGQITVAEGAQRFVSQAMEAQGGSAIPEALLVAEAFSGIVPDGGPLETLLYLLSDRCAAAVGAGRDT